MTENDFSREEGQPNKLFQLITRTLGGFSLVNSDRKIRAERAGIGLSIFNTYFADNRSNVQGALRELGFLDSDEQLFTEQQATEIQAHISNLLIAAAIKHRRIVNNLARISDACEDYFRDRRYDPPRKRTALPEEAQVGVDIDHLFNSFIELEQREPDPTDKYALSIRPATPEYAALAKVAPAALTSGHFTRENLLSAGFVFVNSYSGWEKPIIQAEINGVDFSRRILLTQDELDMVLLWQQENSVSLSEVAQPEAVRRDMHQFMFACASMAAPNGETGMQLFERAFGDLKKRLNREGSRLLDWWYKSQVAENETAFFEAYMRSIYPFITPRHMVGLEIRGHSALEVSTRRSALSSVNSPFLHCGYQFINMPDIQLNQVQFAPVNKPKIRINQMVLHLARIGLSELGDGVESWDQHYATLAEYEQFVYTEDERQLAREREAIERRSTSSNERVLNEMEDTIFKLANEWGRTAANDEVRNLISQVEFKVDDQLPK